MKLSKKELTIIADELRTKIDEYSNFDDVDDEYYEKVQAIYQKILTSLL